MITNKCFKRFVNFSNHYRIIRSSSSAAEINLKKLDQDNTDLQVIDEEAAQKEKEIEQKRNKSRLKAHHRNILFESDPYPEGEIAAYQNTLKYKRRLYGRYGLSSGVNPSICWPVKEELDDALEYERVAYPFTIPEMIETSRKKREEKEEKNLLRQKEIVKKMEKLDDWIKDLHARIAKKEADANSAKERRERLVEEVRRHFGYTVDPRDEKFKQMLEKKEKEQKKAMKEARRKVKEEQMLAQLVLKGKETKAPPSKKSVENKTD